MLTNAYCENQVFALGNHLAMQCHIEMTREMVEAWCQTGAREISRSRSPAVQSVTEIKADLGRRFAALHRVADGVYRRWIAGPAA